MRLNKLNDIKVAIKNYTDYIRNEDIVGLVHELINDGYYGFKFETVAIAVADYKGLK